MFAGKINPYIFLIPHFFEIDKKRLSNSAPVTLPRRGYSTLTRISERFQKNIFVSQPLGMVHKKPITSKITPRMQSEIKIKRGGT